MSDRDLPENEPRQSGVKLPMRPEFQLFVDHYLPPAKGVLIDTQAFFETMSDHYSLKDAAIFASVGLTTYGILSKLMLFQINAIKEAPVNVILTFALAGMMSGIFFGLAKAQGGKGSIEDTAKVVCYASCTYLLAWIPVLGVVPGLYGIYLTAIGIKVVHQLTLTKALVTTLLPSFFIFGLIFLMQVMAMTKH
jgi:hypothetical protein